MQKLINFSLQQHPLVLGYLALALFIGACLFACLYTLNVLRVQHARQLPSSNDLKVESLLQ